MVPRSIHHQGFNNQILLIYNFYFVVSHLSTFLYYQDAQLENYFTNDVFSDLDVHQIGRPIKRLLVRHIKTHLVKIVVETINQRSLPVKQVVMTWFCLLIYGGFKLLQCLSIVVLWKIISIFVFFLVIVAITMGFLIQNASTRIAYGSRCPRFFMTKTVINYFDDHNVSIIICHIEDAEAVSFIPICLPRQCKQS